MTFFIVPVFALWSAPRSRSTAFFRSMLERTELLALHEPLEGLHFIGPMHIGAVAFELPPELVEWLLNKNADRRVFIKETVNAPVQDIVLQDRHFLAKVHHAFLIRHPAEIAASWYALEHDRRILDTGVETLHDLFVAVQTSGGHVPVVVDSDDLVARPAETMAAYCAAVGLPFSPAHLEWEPGARAEWDRSARWHTDAAASSGFVRPTNTDRHRLMTHAEVMRFTSRHVRFYEMLLEQRLDVSRSATSTSRSPDR